MTRVPSQGPRFPRPLRSLEPPASVQEIVARLQRAGHETWCVGGAVRDALLGHAHLDWDLATAATPDQVMRIFKRTVPVGVEFGTVGVLDDAQVMHEVTTFRRDVRTDGRHAVVEFGASLDDDLARRDFTMNAIAFQPKTGEIRDPFDGRRDLQRGIVRAVGVAQDRMREDRLRALRAIRFAARFGFHIEPETWQAILASAPHLGRLSAERVKEELKKTMEQVEKPSVALEWWRTSGALERLVPAIAMAPVERFHALDHLPRAGATGATDPRRATLDRLAMLFFGLDERSALAATKTLKFSNADSAWIAKLAGARHALGEAMDRAIWSGEPGDAQVRRWVAAVGRTRTDAFLALSVALWSARLAEAPDPAVSARLAPFAERAARSAFHDPIELADLAVDGEDLGGVGIPPGPALGRVLQQLLDRVVEDPSENTRDRLLERARGLAPVRPP